MVDAGILNGDYIFVKSSYGSAARSSSRSSATRHREVLLPEKDHVRFQPANKNMAPSTSARQTSADRCCSASWSGVLSPLRLAGLERVLDRPFAPKIPSGTAMRIPIVAVGRHAGTLLLGCGGVHYAIAATRRASRVEEGEGLGADQLAPLRSTISPRALQQAQVEAAEASYSDAANLAEEAEEHASTAIELTQKARRTRP